MDRDERISRMTAQAEKARQKMREFEEGEIGISAALGRASFDLISRGEWPTKTALLSILAAASAGTVSLENVTRGMAKAAHDLISDFPD